MAVFVHFLFPQMVKMKFPLILTTSLKILMKWMRDGGWGLVMANVGYSPLIM